MVLPETAAQLPAPLVLQHPLELQVLIAPSHDTAGKPWRLVLLSGLGTEMIATGRTDMAGHWRRSGTAAGSYRLVVSDSAGSRVAMEELTVTPSTAAVLLELPFIELSGRVMLGDEPLQAGLAFGGGSGPVSVRVSTNEKGRFSGVLPRAGDWDVDVRAHDPPVFRRLRDIPVEVRTGSEKAWVEITLPDTTLEGEVVDEQGSTVAGASILLLLYPATENVVFGQTDEEGRFRFRGVAPGIYRLEARIESPDGSLSSDPVELSITDESPQGSIRLVLRRSQRVRGRVVSTAGGVPGATVTLVPLTLGAELPGLMVPTAHTDPAGQFELALSGTSREAEMTVMAPGFLLERRHVTLSEESELIVPLSQNGGGWLRLAMPESFQFGAFHQPHPYVLLNGTTSFELGTLLKWAALHRVESSPRSVAAPAMPSGIYTACWPRHDDSSQEAPWRWACQDGFLPSGGTLELGSSSPKPPEP